MENIFHRINSVRNISRQGASATAIAITIIATSPNAFAEQEDSQAPVIVVTAQKRTQSIQEVPYNISAISSDNLRDAGAIGANDLSRVVSGLSVVDEGEAARGNRNSYALRGLKTESAGSSPQPNLIVSSVSTYYGDTPVFFNLMLKDLDRVEVLRGPQGTLYGSGSESGTIRFVPNRPDFKSFSGSLNVAAGYTKYSTNGNRSIDGALNIPITENLAFRVAAAYNYQGGFIDAVDRYQFDADGIPLPSIGGNPTSGPLIGMTDRATNNSRSAFLRAALRYAPTDQLDIELSYLHQKSSADDAMFVNPNYFGRIEDLSASAYPNATFQTNSGGPYKNTLAYAQPNSNKIDMGSGTLSYDFGFATMTSVTSYYETHTDAITDGTYIYTQGFMAPYFFYPRLLAVTDTQAKERGLVQELRLVSGDDKPFSYVFGVYYERRRQSQTLVQTAPGLDQFAESLGQSSANPQLPDQIYYLAGKNVSTDKAIFGELTYKITPKWHATGGVRFFRNEFSTDLLQQFPFSGALFGDGVSEPASLGTVRADARQKVTDHIFKFNTSYDFTPEIKAYATYSRGFRRGGANGLPVSGFYASLPQYTTYNPDFADNYEVGIKGTAFNRRFSYSVDAFWIDLNNFQFIASAPSALLATFNGDKARSKGIESEFSYRLSRLLRFNLSYTYTDSKVVDGTDIIDLVPGALFIPGQPTTTAASIGAGARLPGVSKHTANASIDWNIPLAGEQDLVVHLDGAYRSAQNSFIDTGNPQYFRIPHTFTGGARLTYDPGTNWTISAFVTNVTNSPAYSGGGGVQSPPNLYGFRVVGRPRTLGAAMSFSF